jgi:AcrR family transcriptional regulator
MTRAELVRAGRTLFSREGIYEARVEDLAQLAGIGKGTLYLYFANKQDLVQAVVEGGFRELEKRLDAGSARSASLPELVDALVEEYTEFFELNPDLLRILHQARGILKFRRREWLPLRTSFEQHLTHLTRLLGRVSSPVRERPARRRSIAIILFGAISGACSVRVALKSGPGAEVWSRLLRAGLSGLSGDLASGRRSHGPTR